MNFSISVSGYQEQATEDESAAFEAALERKTKEFVASLAGVTSASVSTDRVRVVDAKGA